MYFKKLFALILSLTTLMGSGPTVPKVSDNMLYADFWINSLQKPHNIIMDKGAIDRYNKNNIAQSEHLVDIRNYKQSLTKNELQNLINSISILPKFKRYDINGNLITQAYYDKAVDNLNLTQINQSNPVRYGISVTRTEMRTFPTYDRIFNSSDDYEIDRWMETAVYALEPLIILSQSKDGGWYFVQMYNYLGWVPVKDVALTSREQLFNYIDTQSFLVVTGSRAYTNYNPINRDISELQLDMGAKLPMAAQGETPDTIDGQSVAGNYAVKIATRDSRGNLKIKLALISKSEDVNIGYLPYTRANIIKQAFKMQGHRYGWGGMFNSRDCSAFIMDIYRSMGIMLPRNAGQQGKTGVGKYYSMPESMSLKEREKILDKLQPGAALYMDGHVALYLGKHKGEHYIIHAFSGYHTQETIKGKRELKYHRVMGITVTPLGIYLANGKSYTQVLYGAKEFVLE